MGHAKGCGQQAAAQQADQHAEVADKARKARIHQQRDGHRRHAQQQVGGVAEVRRPRVAATQPDGRRRHQRDTDDGDQAADHHRREEAQQPAEKRREADGDGAGGNHGAKHLLQAELLADHDHRCQRDERAALDQRQACPKAPETEGLDQCGDARGEQVGVDQRHDLRLGQAQCAAEDERHRDRAGIHHQHVLQAKGEQLPQR